MQVIATSKQLLAFAFLGGAYVDILSFDTFPNVSGFTSRTITPVDFMVPTSKSSASGATSFSVQDFEKLKPYWELLADAANGADGKKVSAYMFSMRGREVQSVSAAIELGKNSSVVVKDAMGHDITLKANEVAEILLLAKRQGSADLSVQWTKDHKDFNKGTISNFSGGDFKFSLHTGAAGSP
jgi:hypothetical protein